MSDGAYSTIEIRRRAVKAVARGVPVGQVAESYNVDRSTIYRWVTRFEEVGDVARRPGSGRPRKLQELTEAQLRKIVLAPASQYGFETDLWTVGRLRGVLYETYGIPISKNTVWRRLREAGLTYQKPERQYFEIDEQQRRKWLRYEVPKIRRAVKKYRAILYFEDESNISLTALLGKTWAPRGQTPKAEVTGRRGSVSALSAISPRGRLLFRLHDKRIASAQVIEFLGQMLKHHKRRHLVVVMDQAPPHVSQKTQAYIETEERLHVFYLPKYSPDWNPDEKAWNHLKHQELSSHRAKTQDELKQLARRKLQSMAKRPKLLRGLFFRCYVANFLG